MAKRGKWKGRLASVRFRRLIKSEEYEEALNVDRQKVENGAQIIDINMDEGMLDVTTYI